MSELILDHGETPVFTLGQSRVFALASPPRGAHETTLFRAFVGPGESTSPHYHDHEELLSVLSGSGRLRIGNREYSLTAGDTAVIPAGEVHVATADGEPWECLLAGPAGLRYFDPDGHQVAPPPWAAELSDGDAEQAPASKWLGTFY